MKNSYFLPIMLAASLLFNCKGKDGAPGPVGATGPLLTEETYILPKEGYIKSTLTTTVEGKPATYNFDFQGVYSVGGSGSYEIINDTLTVIYISRNYAKDGEALVYGSTSLTMSVGNLVSLSKSKITNFYISASKRISSGTTLRIDANGNIGNNTFNDGTRSIFTLTDLKFNAANNVVEGKFTATLKYYNYFEGGQSKIATSTVSNGSFSCKLSQIIRNTRKSN